MLFIHFGSPCVPHLGWTIPCDANPRLNINALILVFLDRHLWGFVIKPQGQSKAEEGQCDSFLGQVHQTCGPDSRGLTGISAVVLRFARKPVRLSLRNTACHSQRWSGGVDLKRACEQSCESTFLPWVPTSRFTLAEICSTILVPPVSLRGWEPAQKVEAEIWVMAKRFTAVSCFSQRVSVTGSPLLLLSPFRLPACRNKCRAEENKLISFRWQHVPPGSDMVPVWE